MVLFVGFLARIVLCCLINFNSTSGCCCFSEDSGLTVVERIPAIDSKIFNPSNGSTPFFTHFRSNAVIPETIGPIKNGKTDAKPPLWIIAFLFLNGIV